MLKMSQQLENIVNAYKTLAKVPAIVGGRLNNAGNRINAKFSIRNLDKGKLTKYLYNYTLDDKFDVVAESDFGIDASNELLSAVSPKETYRAVIREEKEKDAKKQYLEVWQSNRLAHSIDLTALDIHGDVYADAEFGSLDWTRDETAVVYIAEKKLKKSEPYYKRKGAKDAAKSDGSGETPPKQGEEYLYRQDWGEQLVGKYMSVVVVCQLETETVSVLEGLPESWCPGQVRFTPDGKSVVGVAWETEPRRLGLIFCTSRPSFIFTLTLDGVMKKLSADGLAVKWPRVHPSGDRVLWLQRSAGGPHHACHSLVSANVQGGEVSTIIDIVQTEIQTANKRSFFGLYNALPERCFSEDGKRMVFATQTPLDMKIYVVNVDDGNLVELKSLDVPGSMSVLDVRSDVILATYSNMKTPGQLYIAKLPPAGSEDALIWKRVSAPVDLPKAVSNASIEYLNLEHKSSTDTVKTFSALYFAPTTDGGKKLPLVVWPHGGPHSAFINGYSLEAALFAMMGFASLQVNYRGSIGSGQVSVDYLLKRVGDADVLDCKLATEEVVNRHPVDSNKLCLFGGSHGGFLVAHLSGQYPETYSAVVSRNPVVDIASMFNSSDIADWCAVEAGFKFREDGPVSEEELVAMRRCSPMVHVHKVKAPTALMLGSVDKRVPYYQGLEYHRRLKANGVVTRLYMYEDNHSLSSLPVEMDNLINSVHWFVEHLQV